MKKTQISTESYYKLNRAKSLSRFLHLDLIHREINGMHQFYLSHLFSYIADDICFVLNELEDKELFEGYIKKQN